MTDPSGSPELDPARRLASRGAAATAVIALIGGSALLGLQSCAQTSATQPIQPIQPSQPSQAEPRQAETKPNDGEPKPREEPGAITDPSRDPTPEPDLIAPVT